MPVGFAWNGKSTISQSNFPSPLFAAVDPEHLENRLRVVIVCMRSFIWWEP